MSTNQTAEQLGREVLRDQADPLTIEAAARLVLEGKAEWVHDPYVPHVVGLVAKGTDRAFVVVYLAGHPEGVDFELSGSFEELL